MSRTTPPTQPVMVPMTIQTQKGSPASKLLLMPVTVNRPSPMASNMNRVLPNLSSLSLNSRAETRAKPVVRKYLGSVIQKGLTSNNKSLVVPPPMAVTKPMIKAPNQSICFPDAKRIPLMAKAKVPIRSSMTVMFDCKFDSIGFQCLQSPGIPMPDDPFGGIGGTDQSGPQHDDILDDQPPGTGKIRKSMLRCWQIPEPNRLQGLGGREPEDVET